MISFRTAEPDDLTAVVDVFWACWTRTYPAVLPEALIARLDRSAAERLWAASSLDSTVVAADDRTSVVGVTRTGGDTVHSLYVHPDAHGLGVGGRLLRHAEAQIAARGHAVGRLWVFEHNAPSRQFYAKRGWEPDGTTQVTAAFGEPEVRLAKPLEAAAELP